MSRIDSGLYQGARVSPYYDSMIAKLIVKGADRADVITKSKRILKEFMITGISTTIPFFLWILEEEMFINNSHHISSIDMMSRGRVTN